MTVEEVAQALGKNNEAVYRMAQEGVLDAWKEPHPPRIPVQALVFSPEAVREYQEGGAPPEDGPPVHLRLPDNIYDAAGGSEPHQVAAYIRRVRAEAWAKQASTDGG